MEPVILYNSPYVPPEWIAAHGFRPMRPTPGSGDSAREILSAREGLCPWARHFANAALSGPDTAGVVLGTTCDQIRRLRDIFASDAAIPFFLFHVPSVWQTASAHALYLSELDRLGRFLIAHGGRSPASADLAAVMDRYDRERRSMMDSVPRHAPAGNRPAIPIAFLGGDLTREDLALYAIVAECGGRVVLDGTETGTRVAPARFDRRRLAADPLRELADAYFGTIPDVFRRPNSALFEWIRRETAQHAVRGAVLIRQVWCDLWHAESARIREWLSVPMLDLDRDGEPCRARERTRIQAFVESLQ